MNENQKKFLEVISKDETLKQKVPACNDIWLFVRDGAVRISSCKHMKEMETMKMSENLK